MTLAGDRSGRLVRIPAGADRGGGSVVGAESVGRELVPHSVRAKGKLLVGTDGQSLGRIVDVRIDEHSGRIEGYDLSRGRLMRGKRAYLPVADGFVAGDDVVLAPAGAAERLRLGPPRNDGEELTSARA